MTTDTQVQQNIESTSPTLESLSKHMRRLNRYFGMSWTEIHATRLFSVLPIGTFYRFKNTGHLPRKYWKKLGVKAARETDRVAISKVDMESAAQTIVKNLEPDKVAELAILLWEVVNE